MAPKAIISWAFVSVTEHHGGDKLLTRVAVLQRVRIIVMYFLVRVNCINYIHQAAERIGLARLEPGDEKASRAL